VSFISSTVSGRAVLVLAMIIGLHGTNSAWATVCVLSNQSGMEISLEQPEQKTAGPLRIGPGVAVRIDGGEDPTPLILTALGHYQSKVELKPYGVYFATMHDDQLQVKEIDLQFTAEMREALIEQAPAATDPPLEIEVKLLVDEDQPAKRALWEPLLRRRVARASDHLYGCCRVRLKVVAVDSWNSDNSLTDVSSLAAEFRRQVNPAPARLAIGFTFQQRATVAEVLGQGAIDKPLASHLLLPLVDSPATTHESTKEMLLVHELGHYLGAVHALEPATFMQATWEARTSRDCHAFDPINMLTMNLVREQLQGGAIDSLDQLSQQHKQAVGRCYATLSQALEDPWRDTLRKQLLTPQRMPPRRVLPRDIRAAQAQPGQWQKPLGQLADSLLLGGQ
jgi:hypothetical protein